MNGTILTNQPQLGLTKLGIPSSLGWCLLLLIMATPLWLVAGNGLFLALVLPDYHQITWGENIDDSGLVYMHWSLWSPAFTPIIYIMCVYIYINITNLKTGHSGGKKHLWNNHWSFLGFFWNVHRFPLFGFFIKMPGGSPVVTIAFNAACCRGSLPAWRWMRPPVFDSVDSVDANDLLAKFQGCISQQT